MGQLMQPELGASNLPVSVHKLDTRRIVTLACSPFHTIVLTDGGELFAAGV